MTSTVTVASKMPNGLVLRLFNMEDTMEPVQGGGSRKVKVAREVDGQPRYTIDGVAAEAGKAPRAAGVASGFALTPGIPLDFWTAWLEQNKTSDMVVNGLIFASEATRDVRAEAREKKDQRSGLEAIDPRNLPRGVEQAPEQTEKPVETELMDA